jgi:hypothetical protein
LDKEKRQLKEIKSMRHISIILLVALLTAALLLPTTVIAATDVNSMTVDQRNELLLEILQANAKDALGQTTGTRGYDSISKAAPVYIGQTATFSITTSQTDVWMTVRSVVYGKKANTIVEEANMFNSEPGDNQEFIVVTLFIETAGSGTESEEFNSYDFDFISRSGAVYKNSSLVSGLNDSAELYSGASDEIQIGWLIDKGDIPYLLYEGAIWFDLTPIK